MKSTVDSQGGGCSDHELMARFQKGDAGAMEELVKRHGPRLFGFLVRMTGSAHAAEDAYQEVFLKVIKNAKKYRPGAGFSSWLFTIARNAVIDQARKRALREAASLDAPANPDSAEARIDMQASPGPDPEEDMRARQMTEVIEKAVAGLADEQREVFLLRERAGLSIKEVAKITRAPVNTVKTRMYYALGHIKDALKEAGMMDGE